MSALSEVARLVERDAGKAEDLRTAATELRHRAAGAPADRSRKLTSAAAFLEEWACFLDRVQGASIPTTNLSTAAGDERTRSR